MEITGHTATVGGKRVVVAQQVRLYADSHGKPLPPMPDSYYTDSDAPGTVAVAQQMQSASFDDMPAPPDPTEQTGGSSLPLSFTEGTIAWAKSLEDGAGVSLTGKIITRDWPDYFYIEEDTFSKGWSGIRVEKTAHGHVKAERVNVAGALATNSDGERYIAATTITQNGSGTLNPLGMNNKWLGGGDFAYDPGPPISGQRGITGASGLNNIGLLVRIWGKITAFDMANPPEWFRIDDGSGVQAKVAYPPYGCNLNDSVAISGISSCEPSGGDLLRVIRPQALTCTITKATGQSATTNTTPINFTVIFSEPVTDFDDHDDVSISGTAGGTKTITITQTDTEGQHYNVAVSNLTYGTVIASVPAGKAQNTSGVWNYASTSTDDSVAYRGSVVYVKTQADGGSDGNSGWRWDVAKQTVQAGLNTASTEGEAEVWVAKGTYYERITLPAGKALYGGFAGNETATNQRSAFPRSSPDSNETVLDAQHGGNVVTATSTNVHNNIDGFTIQNGSYGVTATSVLPIYNCKICLNSTGIRMTSLTIIRNNEIFSNSSDGIYLSSSFGGTVEANSIHDNSHRGIFCDGGSGYVIDRNRIEYNNTSG